MVAMDESLLYWGMSVEVEVKLKLGIWSKTSEKILVEVLVASTVLVHLVLLFSSLAYG